MNLVELPFPLWVLGTDTGVGKTYVAARIAEAWSRLGPVVYRKPFQTGVTSAEDPAADAREVRGPGILAETGLTLRAPLSPLAASELERKPLDLDSLFSWASRDPGPGAQLLLEGVGGVLVPLSQGLLFADWAAPMKFPAVVVARGGLGTLNHTLLTCEALLARGWNLAALILNPGVDGSQGIVESNVEILRRFLRVRVDVL